MLSNAYLLAKLRVDTAENFFAEFLPKTDNYASRITALRLNADPARWGPYRGSGGLVAILALVASCGRPRPRPMHKSLHSSKSYCECSTTKQKAENEENMLLGKSENNTTYIRARHVFIRRPQGGREKRREGRMATDKT